MARVEQLGQDPGNTDPTDALTEEFDPADLAEILNRFAVDHAGDVAHLDPPAGRHAAGDQP